MKVTENVSLVSVTDEMQFPKLMWKNLAKAFASPLTGFEYISNHLNELVRSYLYQIENICEIAFFETKCSNMANLVQFQESKWLAHEKLPSTFKNEV